MKEEKKVVEKKVTEEKIKNYVAPQMEKHDPIKVVQGSGGGCSGLYYTSLYYYY